jgi:DNA processing protein
MGASGRILLLKGCLSSVTNREVFAVPGNITSRNSFGTNYLIKGAGAKLVQAWQDIVSEFPPDIAAQILPPELKNASAKKDVTLPCDLSAKELSVLSLLSADEPAHIDALAGASKLPVQELTGVLLGLEMRELIRQLPGKSFVRKL